MIRVEVCENGSRIAKIHVKGHAGQGSFGHDLCCAAVSAILFGGFNALDEKGPYRYDIKEGDALLEVTGTISDHDQAVLATILVQLRTIEQSYPKNIEIKSKKE